jgi:hypothetical protein
VASGRSVVQSAVREGDGVVSLDYGGPSGSGVLRNTGDSGFSASSLLPLLLWAGVVNWLPLGGGGVVERGLGIPELPFYS